MKPGAVATTSSTVAFSWEHEPGVSKQSPAVEAKKPGPEAGGRTQASAQKAAAQPHWLRVPPPPGGLGAPAVSPPARSRSRSRGAVRAEDDPFLAAYLACTANGRKAGSAAGEPKGRQKLLGWAGLGPGIGLRRGLGLSCKSSGVVVESVVRLAKIPERSG